MGKLAAKLGCVDEEGQLLREKLDEMTTELVQVSIPAIAIMEIVVPERVSESLPLHSLQSQGRHMAMPSTSTRRSHCLGERERSNVRRVAARGEANDD